MTIQIFRLSSYLLGDTAHEQLIDCLGTKKGRGHLHGVQPRGLQTIETVLGTESVIKAEVSRGALMIVFANEVARE